MGQRLYKDMHHVAYIYLLQRRGRYGKRVPNSENYDRGHVAMLDELALCICTEHWIRSFNHCSHHHHHRHRRRRRHTKALFGLLPSVF